MVIKYKIKLLKRMPKKGYSIEKKWQIKMAACVHVIVQYRNPIDHI